MIRRAVGRGGNVVMQTEVGLKYDERPVQAVQVGRSLEVDLGHRDP